MKIQFSQHEFVKINWLNLYFITMLLLGHSDNFIHKDVISKCSGVNLMLLMYIKYELWGI